MNICFLFPGQGAQYPGMGKDLYESHAAVQQLFDMASDICKCDTVKLLFDSDDSVLKETKNTQIAVTLMNLAVRRYLRDNGVQSTGCAGFSLGEWSAQVDAGVISEQEVFPIVMKRAELMTRAAEQLDLPSGSGMAAVIGLPSAEVEKAIAEIRGVFPANYNSPDQTVISGTSEAVGLASEACKAAGARRVIPLKVSGPFHSPLLDEASRSFEIYLRTWELNSPDKSLYSNAAGASVSTIDDIRSSAALQISSPVLWTSEEEHIARDGYDLCIECGPGKVLTGLWKKSGADIPCFSTNTRESIDTLIEEIQKSID